MNDRPMETQSTFLADEEKVSHILDNVEVNFHASEATQKTLPYFRLRRIKQWT